MQVYPQKMRENLDITHGLLMAESVTLALAEFIGKQDAHHLVEVLCRQAIEQQHALYDVLVNDTRITSWLNATQIKNLLEPTAATGSAQVFIDRVLARYKEQQNEN